MNREPRTVDRFSPLCNTTTTCLEHIFFFLWKIEKVRKLKDREKRKRKNGYYMALDIR